VGTLFCNQTDDINQVSVALIGDSTANQLYPGLSKIYKKRGMGLINLGMASCAPLFGITQPNLECPLVMSKTYDAILNHPNIKTVILAFEPADIRHYVFIAEAPPQDDKERLNRMTLKLQEGIKTLQNAGKKVIVTFDNPFITLNPRDCLRADQPEKRTCQIDKEAVDWRMEPYRSFYQTQFSQLPGVCIFSQDRLFADGKFYNAMKDNTLLYRDDHHLSFYGSDYVAQAFERDPCYLK
jgi:hypothetical protein